VYTCLSNAFTVTLKTCIAQPVNSAFIKLYSDTNSFRCNR